MTVDELSVLITANADKFTSEIKKTQSGLEKLQAGAQKTGSILKSVFLGSLGANLLTKALGAVTQNLDGAISRLDTMNNYTNVMSNLGIDAEKSEKSINRLSDALTGLPTTLDDAVQSVQRFTSANGNIEASTEMFLALNNAILAGGAPMQVQKTALEQLSQAYTKGKPDITEWRSAMTAMPAQLKQVAMAMGYVNADQLGAALTKGKVSMNEFMSTLMRLNNEGVNGFKSFSEQAQNSTGGVATSITNVKTAITRGLADIMNAIGQSNIAGFFQGVARGINSVIPYIVAFVKVTMMAVSAVSKLFGGNGVSNAVSGFTDSLKKGVGGANSAMSDLGGSAGGVSTGMNKAAKSAKALKKELLGLAHFDEMTVLKDQEKAGSSGGSGGGGAGGAGGVGAIDFDIKGLDEAGKKADKVQEIVDKILKFLTPLRKIDFQPLVKSFQNLWGAVKPVGSLVLDTLKKAYDKVLVPLAKFTIEKALPAFFNLLAGAIKLLTPILKAFQSAGVWLLDNFLKPIAKFTANVAIAAINGITKAIEAMAKSINGSKTAQAVLDDIATAILGLLTVYATFKAGWKIGEVIQASVVAFQTLKVQAALMAMDFHTMGAAALLSAGNVTVLQIAMALLTGQITLTEAATLLAAKAQAAWNAVMLLNPIVLVVAAVAALAAGIGLLCVAINRGSKEDRENAEAMKQMADEAANLKQEYEDLRAEQQKKIDSGLAEIAHVQALKEELMGLSDSQGRVAESDRARAEFILGELNHALGTEYEMIDGQIQKYDELTKNIDAQIEKKKVEILLGAREVEYREALCNWYDAQARKAEALDKLETAKAEHSKKNNKATKQALEEAQRAYNETSDTVEMYARDIQTYEDAVTANLQGNTQEAIDILQRKGKEFKTFEDTVKLGAEEQKRVLKKQQDESIKDLEHYRSQFKKEVSGYTEEGLRQHERYAEQAKKEFEQAGKNINAGLQQGINGSQGTSLNALNSLASAIKKTFATNLEIHSPSGVFKRYGTNITEGIKNGINGGKSGAIGALGSVASGLVSKFKSMLKISSPSRLFRSFGEFTVEGFVNGVDSTAANAVKSVERMSHDISMADIVPSLDGNVAVNRSLEVTNSMSNQNLIDKLNDLNDKDLSPRFTIRIGDDTLMDKIIQAVNDKAFETNGGVVINV